MLAVLLGSGLPMLAAGGIVLSATTTWTVEAGYDFGVVAPGNLNWTLWVPRPDAPLPLYAITSTVESRGPVETEHGVMENLTGHGEASLSFRFRGTVRALGEVWGNVHLSGEEPFGRPQPGYWVWRTSTNASAVIRVTGHAAWSGEHLEETGETCDALFYGESTEGWSLVPRAFCEGGYRGGLVPWEGVALFFLFVGSLLVISAAAIWRLARRSRVVLKPSPYTRR